MGTFGKFRYHHEVPELLNHSKFPCPFHSSLVKLELPCSEMSYLAIRCHFLFVLLKPLSQLLIMFHQFPFFSPKHLSISFDSLQHLCLLMSSGYIALVSALTSLSFNCQHKCHLFGDVFSLPALLRNSYHGQCTVYFPYSFLTTAVTIS